MKKQSKLKVVDQHHRAQTEVRPSILDNSFKYVNAASTDVTQTWKRFGWKPIENREKHYESNT